MDFNDFLSDLRIAGQEFSEKISDKYAATMAYCETACKGLDRLERDAGPYENQVIGLWVFLGYIQQTYPKLTSGPAITALCQKIFRHCARTVLNIQWQQLDEKSPSRQNFEVTLQNLNQCLSASGYTRFSLILQLMDSGWTRPILSQVMAGEEDNEDGEGLNYIINEDPVILKIRVEMMLQENCEEFALNLCSWCLKHPALKDDLDIRQTQLMLFHKLNNSDRLQEECQKIPCHDGVRLISRMRQMEKYKSLCTRLAQIFLVQDWINQSEHCCTKDLLKLWIRHQYLADRDKEKFLKSVWAIAKLSSATDQILLMIDALKLECGDMFLQLYTDLCIFAINFDKSCLEKHMQDGDMEGLRSRQQAMACTCEKLATIYLKNDTKIARYSAVTSFALNPSTETLSFVEKFYFNMTTPYVIDRGKQTHEAEKCCTNCFRGEGACQYKKSEGIQSDANVDVATLLEVERLLNMLRPFYLNPDVQWTELKPLCQRFLHERERLAQKFAMENCETSDVTEPVPSSSVSHPSTAPPASALIQAANTPHIQQNKQPNQGLLIKTEKAAVRVPQNIALSASSKLVQHQVSKTLPTATQHFTQQGTKISQQNFQQHANRPTATQQAVQQTVTRDVYGSPNTVTTQQNMASVQQDTNSLVGIEPSVVLSEEKHMMIRNLLFTNEDISMADFPDADALVELLQQALPGGGTELPETLQDITMDSTSIVPSANIVHESAVDQVKQVTHNNSNLVYSSPNAARTMQTSLHNISHQNINVTNYAHSLNVMQSQMLSNVSNVPSTSMSSQNLANSTVDVAALVNQQPVVEMTGQSLKQPVSQSLSYLTIVTQPGVVNANVSPQNVLMSRSNIPIQPRVIQSRVLRPGVAGVIQQGIGAGQHPVQAVVTTNLQNDSSQLKGANRMTAVGSQIKSKDTSVQSLHLAKLPGNKMAPATKSVITFIPFPSTASQKLTSHQQQQQQPKSMSNKEQTVSILHKQNPSDCAVKVRKQVFIQQQSLLKKTNIIKKTINQPVFSSNQQSFDGRDVKSVFVKTGINKPVCNKVELNNQVFNKRSINKTDTCKRVNEESMRRGHYIVSQSQKFTTISRQPTYQCSNLMSDQNKMTSVSSSQETKGHVIHRPVAVRPEIKRIQPLSGSVHGRILTPPALVRADVVRTSTATTAPALPSVHVVKTKPYDSSKVNVSLSRGFPSSAKHIIMTARELPSSSVNTVNKCGSSPSTNNTMRNPHVLAVSSSRFGCNVASSCIVMNSNTSTEQAGCGRNKPVVTSCASANHLPCSSSTNNSNYSKLYAMLCAKDINNYENVCNINSSVQVKQSVASSQVNENVSCIPATVVNNVLDTAAIGSDGTDNTVETGSDEVYNTVETGSDELYNTVETGSDGIDNTVETGSDEVYDTLETGSDEVYNTVEIGSKGVDNMEMVGSDRTDDIFEIESNEVDIAGEIRSDRVDDSSEIGSNGVANTVVIESSGTDTKVEIGSDGTDKTVETGSDGTNKTVEIGSDGVCSTVMTESNDQHSETPSSKAAECLEMNILVSNSLKVETQNTGFGTSSTSLKSQKVESSEVKPRVKVTHKLTCNQCKCTFQTHLAYHTHINSHLKNDPVKKTQYKTQTVCNICGKIFKRAFLLKSHIYSHTGEKPYLCSYCKRAFSDPSNCRAHVKTHTDKKKIFSCISCKKSFTQRRYLHKHMTDICHVPVPKWRYDFKKSTKENSSDFPAHKKIIVQFSKNKDESECSSKENELESEASKNKLYEAERDCSEKENAENVKSVDLISLKSSLCIDPKKIPYVSCVRLEEDKNGLFWKSKKQDVSESSDLKHRSDKLEKNAVVKCMRLDEEYPYLRPLFKEMLTNTKAFLTLRPSAKDPRRNVYQLCVAEPAENIEDDEAVQTAKLAAAKAWQSRLVDGDFTTDDEDVDDMQYVSEDDYKSSEDEIIRPHKRKRISSSSDETAFTSDDDFKPNLGIFHWSRAKRKRRRRNTKHKRFKHIHRTTGIEECDSGGSSEISQTSWARYTKRKYKKKTKDLEKEITVKRARGRPKKEKDNSESVNKKEEKLTVKNDAENKNAEPNEQKYNTEKERFNCVECNLRFMQQTNLVLHIVTNHLQNSSFFQRSHFGSEQFVCKYCEKACYSFRDFIHHIPVHATEILEKMTQYVVAKHKFSKKNCRRIKKENNITKPADSSSHSFSESVPLKSEQKNSNTPFISSDKRAEETKPAVSSTATSSVHTVLNPSSALSTHKSNSSRNIIVVSKVKDGSYKINNQSELGVRNTTTQNKPGHHGNNAALDGKQFNNMPSAGGEKIAINYQGEKVTEQNMQICHSGQLQINPPRVADNASSASYPGNQRYNTNMAQYSNPSMTLNQANRSSGNQVNQISKCNINYINQSFPAVEVKPAGSKSSSSFMDSFMSYVQKQEAKQSQMRVTDMKHNRYARNVSTGFAVNDREHRIWNSGCSENNPKQNQTSSSCPKLSNMSPVSTGTVNKIIVTKRSENTSAPHPSDVKTSLPSFGNFRSKPVEQYKQNYIPRNETVVTEGNRRYVTFEVKCPFSNEDKHVNQKYKNYVSRKPQSYGVQQYQPSVQQGVSKEHQYFLTKEKNYSEVHPTDSYQHHVTKHYQHYLNEEHQPHAARENTYFVTGTHQHVTAENNQNVHKQHQHYVTKQSQHHVTEDNKHHTDMSYQHFTEVKKFHASEVNKQCVSEVNKHCVTQECKTFPINKSNPADEKSCNSTTVGQISFSNCSHSVDDRDGSDIIVFGSDSVMSGSEEQTLDKLTQLRVFRNKNLPVTHKTPEVSETENNRPLHDEDESPMNTFVDGVEESLLDSDSVLNTMLNLGNNSSSNNVSPVKQSKAQQVTVTETNEHQNISPNSLTGCYEMSTVKTNYKDTDSVDGRLECKNTQDIIQVEEKKKTSDIKLSNISLPDSGRKEMSEESGSSEQCIVPSSKASEISVKSDMCSLMKINDNIQHRPFDTHIDLQKEMDVCSENFSVTVVPDSRGAVCESNSFCESSKVTDISYKDMKKKKDNESMMMILPEVNEMIPQDVCEMLQMGEIQDNHVISMQNVSESSENTSAPMQDTDAASPVTMECEATLETAPVMSDIVPTLMENISEKEGKDDVTISCEGTLKPIVLNIALTECNSTQPLLIKKQPGQLTLTTSLDLIETLSSTDNSEVKVRKDVNIRNNTDVTTTDSTNVTATGNTDATATGNRDVTAADSTDVTNADSTDVTATDSTDNTATDVTTIDSTCTPVPNKRYVTGTDSKNLICTENIVTMDTNNSLNTKKHNLISQKLKKSKNTKNICCQKMSSRKYLSVKKTVKKKQTFSPVSSSFTSHRVPLCMSKKKKVKTAPKCSKKLDTDVVTSDSNTCFVPS